MNTAQNSNKEKIFNTQLHKLELGDVFNKFFFSHPMMEERLVPIVRELIVLNNLPIPKTQPLICSKSGNPFPSEFEFTMNSPSFKRLENKLIENGFTREDWVLLP